MNTNKVLPPDLDALYKEVDAYEYKPSQAQPPCIGLSANLREGLSCIANTYVNAVLKAGGTPVVIPVTTDPEVLSTALAHLDGLILTGGGDINPLYCNEQPIAELGEGNTFRDQYDLTLLRLAANRQIPIFGICRGHQLINLAYGGTLYQDIHSQRTELTFKHSQSLPREEVSHTVHIEEGSELEKLFGTKVAVNSFHHQAIREVAPGFRATAFSPDGIVEAIESTVPYRRITGVQWHPECMAAAGDEGMIRLFTWFIDQVRSFRKAKNIHQDIVTLDSHCDTPMLFEEGVTLGQKNEKARVNIPLMRDGSLDVACMAAYLKQGARDDDSLLQATDKATRIIKEIRRQVEECHTIAEVAYTSKDIYRLKEEGKKAFLIGIENAYAIGKDLTNLSRFKKLGVTYITLCHNGDNDLCDSALGNNEWNGLSPLGKKVVRKMNRLGIMVDVSHASEKTFYDVIKESHCPILASHSCARAVCNHPRNLTDDQLRVLAEMGGLVQVCLYGGFLNEDAKAASIKDVVKHITHIAKLIGTEFIGIGSDFDGGGGVLGCNNASEVINITQALIEAGFNDTDLQRMWGENFLDIMSLQGPI